eukprot:14379288-Heterocapsa_arctica.AAC.1
MFHQGGAEGSKLSNEHNYWMQIGSQKYPEYPVMSAAGSFYHLKKAVGDDLFIYSRWYRTQKHIMGISTEKVPGTSFTGISTTNGELLTINFRDCDFDDN